MTVVLGSRDVEGDAGNRPVSGRSRGVAGGAWSHPARSALLGPLGSRFWALVDEDSDAEEQGGAELEVRAVAAGFSPPRSPPGQQMLADFLGEEWCVVPPAGHRSSGCGTGFSSESAPTSGVAVAQPNVEISPDLRAPAALSTED
jgi:hypothetical protein